MPTPAQVAAAEDIAERAKAEDRDLTLEEWQRYDALMRDPQPAAETSDANQSV